MAFTLHASMRRLGHIARRRTLLQAGATMEEIAAGLDSGALWRPRRGWVADRLADADQVRAVSAGARLGCVSALRRWGVWSGADDRLHLHAAPTAARLNDRMPVHVSLQVPALPHPAVANTYGDLLEPVRLSTGGRPMIHWSEQRFAGALDWIVSVEDALMQALRCQDGEHAVACIDSALHLGAIDRDQWEGILAVLPRRLRGLDQRKDPRAGSGNETRARLRLVDHGFRVEPQFFILGAGTVDLLVEDCVVVEVDSEAHHGSSTQRRKDQVRALVGQVYGIPTVRIGPESFAAANWRLVVAAVHQQVADARRLNGIRRVIVQG